MTTALDLQCATIWQAVATSDLGLVITTNDPAKARASLYRFRNSIGDTELTPFTIRVSPNAPTAELWIIRQEKTTGFTFEDVL